ncbi:MAG: hypothetical protein HY326_00525 [Chloroflexi bacterium]|nr:hypothetical protein [Chloroflexota bacterium]
MTVRGELANFYERHKNLFTIGLVYTVTRLLAALFTQMTFAAYGPGFPDFVKQGNFTLNGAYPFLQYWMEYPPLFPWLTVAAYRLSLLLPAWDDPVLWFGTLLRWTVLPFEVGTLVLVYAIKLRFSPESDAIRSTVLYALAFTTMYVPLGWFDVLPLFWLLLALYFTLRDQPGWTGLSAGLGLLAKPISALVLPAAWQRLPNLRSRLKLIAITLCSFAVPMLPFLFLSPQMSLAHLRNLLSRSSWESVWAFLDGYYGVGAVAPLDQRFDPSTATWLAHASTGGYGLWVTLGFGLLGVFLLTRQIDWRDARRTVAFVGLTWCLFSLWSKGYSPQWAINFIPFVALLMPDFRGAVYLVLMSIALVAEWPVAFTLAGGQQWYLVAIVIWRTLLIVLLSFELGTIVLAGQPNRFWKGAYWTGIVALLVTGGVIGRYALRGYYQTRLENEPMQPAIRTMQAETTPQTGLICREAFVCQRIALFVPGLAYYWLPASTGREAANLPTFAQQHPSLWLVEDFHKDTGHDVTIENYLSQHYGKVAQDWGGSARVSRFVALDLPSAQSAEATFGCCLRLTSYALHAEDHFINLGLDWQVTTPVTVSYKIFVHVTNSGGEILAQNDQFPAGDFLTTDKWNPNQTVHDLHGLILLEPVASGDRIQVGWYDPNTGQRLPLTGSGKDVFEIVVK